MRLHKRVVAALAATLLMLGVAACEMDPEALEDIDDDAGLEEEGA